MLAVFKREFRAYFTSVVGWLFLAAFFFLFDLYFFIYNLNYGSPYLSYPLTGVVFLFTIIIPVLTMRSMAEDRKTKTDQLLYTAPVSVWKIVFGKYLAMAAVFSIAMAAVCLCPLFLSVFGDVPFAECYLAVLGVWLFGCLEIAVGLFISSITESQVIAAVLSFALLFLGYMMESITGMMSASGNVLTKILNCLSISSPLENFTSGILSISGIVYYVSGTALFLFLTCQLVQKHRWSVSRKKFRRGVFHSGFVVLGIAAAVAVNIFAVKLPERVKTLDLTQQKLYSLTEDTYQLLAAVDKDVTIYVLAAEKSADPTLAKTLTQYADASSHIKVEYIDPAVSPNFYSKYTDTAPTDGSVIAVCEKQSKVIDYNNMYQYDYDYSTYTQSKSAYDGEGQLTSALSYVTNEKLPKVYCIDGHGESALDSSFSDALEKLNISVETITLLKEKSIPSDAAAIIINGPTSDLSKDDAKKVQEYLAGGGRALITTSYSASGDMPQFASVLENYGIEVSNGIVMEEDAAHCYQYPFYLLPDVGSSELTEKVDGYVFVPYAQALNNTQKKSKTLTWTDLLTTSDKAYLKEDIANITSYEREKGDKSQTFTLAANVKDSQTNAEVTVVAASMVFSNDADSIVSGQNLALFKGIAGTFSDGDVSVSIDAKKYTMDSLTVNQAVIYACSAILVVILPIVLLVLGILIWFRRRKA